MDLRQGLDCYIPPLHITPRLTLWVGECVWVGLLIISLSPAFKSLQLALSLSVSVTGHETLLRQGAGALGPTSEAGKGGYILPGMGVPHCPPFLYLRTETVFNLLLPPQKTVSLD